MGLLRLRRNIDKVMNVNIQNCVGGDEHQEAIKDFSLRFYSGNTYR